MSAEILARWQFGITTVYHFFFVPLTIALSMLVAILQTCWVKTGNAKFLRLTKFYGKLFLINFAMGVVTGIVQEFQFGMNWSEYSRFVGDIFGAPLALEALLAFFMESTFLGVWIFGWDRLSKPVHCAMIWLAAIGTLVSSIFILAANSFMQNPVGATYNPATGRAELHNLLDLFTNPVFLATFPHLIASAWMVATAFVACIAGWHLARINRAERLAEGTATTPAADTAAAERTVIEPKAGSTVRETIDPDVDHATTTKPATSPKRGAATETAGATAAADTTSRAQRLARDIAAWRWIMKFGAIGLLISGLLVVVTGDFQGKVMTQYQPMKMAAAEALYDGQDNAPFSVFTVGTLDGTKPVFSVEVPNLLSFLATGNMHAHVEGINDLNQRYTKEFTTPAQITHDMAQLGKDTKNAGVTQQLTQGRTQWQPNIPVTYWTFRLMMGFGFLAMLMGIVMLLALRGGKLPKGGKLWDFLMWVTPLLPLFAISFGWIFTEMGRQPWLVFGVLPTMAGVSPTVTSGEVLFSMVVFTLVYGAFAVVEVGLLRKFIHQGLPEAENAMIAGDEAVDTADKPMSFAY